MNKFARKFAVSAIAISTAVSMSGFVAPIAGAQSIDDLLAQIAALQAQIAALSGGSSGACYTFTTDLTVGSTGTEVTNLQTMLEAAGHFTYTGAKGYFGSITQAAVAAWQAANGVAPAAGYWGPISRAAYNASCTTTGTGTGTGTTGSTTLSGGAGTIEDADWISNLNLEKVGEDEDDVDVAGLNLDAEGSDIELMAVRLDFTQSTGATADFDHYASDVSLWYEGDEFARVDADEFTDDNNYDKTVTLDSGAVIEDGDNGDLVLAISGINNLDSNDATDTWTVEFESIRFRDGSGAIITDNATGDINGVTRSFTFETYATAANSELKIAVKSGSAGDAVNEGHLINVVSSGSGTTQDVEILYFTLEAKGDSDLEFREFGVDIVVSATNTDVDSVIAGGTSPAVELWLDGDTYGTASYNEDADGVDVGADEEILFDDIDYTLPAGEKIDGKIIVDLLDLSGDLTLGDTIYAQITETQTDDTALVDVRDESGEQLADADITGTATSEASEVRDVGFDVALVAGYPTADPSHLGDVANTNDHDRGQFVFVFDVTAWDGDIFIDETAPDLTGGATEMDLTLDSGVGTVVSSVITCTNCTDSTNSKKVVDGETARFTVTVEIESQADGQFLLAIDNILYALTDVDGDLSYTFNLEDFVAGPLSLNYDA